MSFNFLLLLIIPASSMRVYTQMWHVYLDGRIPDDEGGELDTPEGVWV